MAVVAGELISYKATTNDDTANCGGAINVATVISDATSNNLFGAITGQEALDGVTKYRKSFKKNTNVADTWYAPRTWISQQPANCAVHVGIGISDADDIQGKLSVLTQFAAAAVVALISDGTDTRNVYIKGENGSGVFVSETLALTSAVEVLSVNTYTKVYSVCVATNDAARTVLIKEGSAGTTRGTIAPNGKNCMIWRTGTDIDTKAEGFAHGDIAAAGVIGIWYKLVISPATTQADDVVMKVKTEGSA